ncbi:hypothetical protein RV01_GL002431 [Enterococcus dispar]|nr:hypothetical protein RV01_GL002431 [Enterococcus dispar]
MQKSKKKQSDKIFGNWDNRFYRRLSFILKQRGNVDGSVGSD